MGQNILYPIVGKTPRRLYFWHNYYHKTHRNKSWNVAMSYIMSTQTVYRHLIVNKDLYWFQASRYVIRYFVPQWQWVLMIYIKSLKIFIKNKWLICFLKSGWKNQNHFFADFQPWIYERKNYSGWGRYFQLFFINMCPSIHYKNMNFNFSF